ncbi:MAG: endopeptidase [Proteobacteria bacterium]|nr:MAG: endopeptidase [Pseudomonadota bacterium]
MFKKVVLFVCLLTYISAAYLEERRWEKGQSFLAFLEANSIPTSIYYQLDRQDRELTTEIRSDILYQILKNENGRIDQILIPVSEELQIHLIRDSKTEQFSFQTTPILYQNYSLSVVVEIQNNPYQDIIKATNNKSLANEFVAAYKKSVNFRHAKKGDKLAIFYSQKKRLGKRFGDPIIKAAMIEINKKKHYVFLHNDGSYFDDKGRQLEGYLLTNPLRHYKRISSRFTRKRWHPILRRYRAHLGIDYAAKSGTHVKSAGNGVVSFVGRKGGYGKTIEIRHKSGYKTLYAHLRGYKKGIKRGKRVKKGQHIGYVGSTGRSTGPHLHFGLYKNNRAINPSRVIRVAKNVVTKKQRKAFNKMVKNYKKKFKIALDESKIPVREKGFNYIVLLEQDRSRTSAN